MRALILCFLGACLFAKAQDTIPDPEFTDRVYILKAGKLENIERADALLQNKTIAFGYGGFESFYITQGSQSVVRFRKTALPRFFIKFSGKVDPDDKPLTASIAEIKSGQRKFRFLRKGLFGKQKDISTSFVIPTLKRVRGELYEIVFTTTLESGEYAFLPTT